MFNPSDVFPHPNLSDQSTPWARKLTEAVRSVGYEVTRHGQLINGNNRASSAQLGLVSRQLDQLVTQQTALQTQQGILQTQVNELTSRRTHFTSPADVSVTVISSGTTYTNWYSANRGFSFPGATGGTRVGLLSFSFGVKVNSGSGPPAVAVGIKKGSTYIWKSLGVNVNPDGGGGYNYPPGWGINFSALVPVTAGTGTQSFTLELNGSMYGTTNRVVTAHDITASMQYGDLV